ncbi:hypothetical protein [Actinophytocola oryzae]|uniref:Thioesterase domain-containing protein n=1 Tax=Actinophytocola oryzae TaxID=502181 RepID=A0A4V3FT28_9PSEU|nr:hypothetical protein [Actinophytocola oryzae]TDV49711.1 hypothetical protein CLV71_10750 [Actinophytocola oryzae]
MEPLTEPTDWQLLCDRGADLVLCLDFAGGRATAGFAELASGTPVDACFLHIRPPDPGAEPDLLDTRIERWVGQVLGIGRPVSAVLGFCGGASLATCVADAICAAGCPPPRVVLFDAVVPAGATALHDQFVTSVTAYEEHLTEAERDGAHRYAGHLLDKYPNDLPGVAAALAGRYDTLMVALAGRLGLSDVFRKELTRGFTSYLTYLQLANQGRLDTHTGTPLFVSSKDHELDHADATTVSLDVDRAELLRDAETNKLVADVLRGEFSW